MGEVIVEAIPGPSNGPRSSPPELGQEIKLAGERLKPLLD